MDIAIDALQSIVDGQQQQVALARSRHELGAADELDWRRAQSELAASEARLAALEGERALYASRIAVLSGGFPSALALRAGDASPAPARPLALGTPRWMLPGRTCCRNSPSAARSACSPAAAPI